MEATNSFFLFRRKRNHFNQKKSFPQFFLWTNKLTCLKQFLPFSCSISKVQWAWKLSLSWTKRIYLYEFDHFRCFIFPYVNTMKWTLILVAQVLKYLETKYFDWKDYKEKLSFGLKKTQIFGDLKKRLNFFLTKIVSK